MNTSLEYTGVAPFETFKLKFFDNPTFLNVYVTQDVCTTVALSVNKNFKVDQDPGKLF